MVMVDTGRLFEACCVFPMFGQAPITALVAIIYCALYMGPLSLVGALIIIGYYPYQVCKTLPPTPIICYVVQLTP